MYNKIIKFIQQLYNSKSFIPLHKPKFNGNEKKYLNGCIDSTFVSSVGDFVDKFEKDIATYTNSKYAIATVNGTSALHIALILANVKQGDEVITQALSFVATANAISYCKASPIFIDVDKKTLGMSHKALKKFLKKNTFIKDNKCINKKTRKTIKACVPMHTFGHPCKIDKIVKICKKYHIDVVEDAAESLGSFYKKQHTGTFGKLGILSFNGNKIITTGGGGMILTNDKKLANKAKHLTTTAKIPHKYDYYHNEIGYNYRMPNINAALGVAGLENIIDILKIKREIAKQYEDFCYKNGIDFVKEPKNAKSNYWLNAIILKNKKQRDLFLEQTNNNFIMTRPIWKLLNKLPIYQSSKHDGLKNSKWLEKRVVNIPSGVNI